MPTIGQSVLYVWRPGQIRAGEVESAAIVTRVNADGSLNLRVFPDGTPDVLQFQRVVPMSEAIHGHCWREAAPPAGVVAVPVGDGDDLRPGGIEYVPDVRIALEQVQASHADLVARLAALEAKRGPGRPPKPKGDA